MTIDEAIAHAREVAMNNREQIGSLKPEQFSPDYFSSVDIQNEIEEHNDACRKCAEEHEQLVRWLEELKDLRALFKCEAFRDGIDALRDRIYEHEKSTGQMPDMDIINCLVERLKRGEYGKSIKGD